MKRFRALALLFPAMFVGTIVACSGGDDSIGPSGDDGGGDALVGNDTGSATDSGGGGQDTGMGDDSSGANVYCSALAAYDQRCSRTDACSQAELAICTQNSATLTPAFAQSEATCRAQEPCPGADAGAKKAYDQCVVEAIVQLTPTSTQTKLAQDACAACAPDAGGCVANFYRISTDGGKDGPGAALIVYSDAIISDIDTSCFSGADAGGCMIGSGCVRKAIEKNVPPRPAACKSDAGDAGAD